MLSDEVFAALGDTADKYIKDAAESLGYIEPGQHGVTVRKISRTLLIAAVIASLLAVTAYAAGLFSISRRAGLRGERFIVVNRGTNSFLDWRVKYIFEFEGPEECRAAKFKPGWLPFEPNEGVNAWAKDEDGYYKWLVSECADGVDSTSMNYQPYRIELFYAPQFEDGGAMILMGQEPEKIIDEQWGDLQILKFHAARYQEEIPGDSENETIPATTYNYYFVIMFDPNEGSIVVVSGTSDMETIEHVARELEIVHTDEIIRKSDFERNCEFIDVAQG